MKTVSIADAKNRLSELIVRVEAGEEFAVTRHGKPVARLVAVGEVDDAVGRRARLACVAARASRSTHPMRPGGRGHPPLWAGRMSARAPRNAVARAPDRIVPAGVHGDRRRA